MKNPLGYSGKPLVTKLGYQPGQQVFLYKAPIWFQQKLSESAIIIVSTLPSTHAHAFVVKQKDLHNLLDKIDLNDLQQALWISWPKRVSKVETDITEQDLRDIILPLGWVDIKVVAIDEIWSGLKFVRRKKLNN